jgi:hypothetical protein
MSLVNTTQINFERKAADIEFAARMCLDLHQPMVFITRLNLGLQPTLVRGGRQDSENRSENNEVTECGEDHKHEGVETEDSQASGPFSEEAKKQAEIDNMYKYCKTAFSAIESSSPLLTPSQQQAVRDKVKSLGFINLYVWQDRAI